jgi:hypothetical protein
MALPTYQSLASEEELDDQALGSGALPGGSASVSPLSQASIPGSSQASGALPASGALNNITSSVGALQKSGFDAFGNPRGDTWTEGRYNPDDPASSSYIADPNAGQYVFDPVTGKHTLVADTAPNLKTFVTENIGNPQAIALYAKQYGASDQDLSVAMGIPVSQVHDYFRQAGMPLGTMLTGTLQRDIGTETGIRQLDKGEDVVAERAIGMQGNQVLVQQYDAYGQPTGTRLATPNAPDYAGWIQALGLVLPGALPGVGQAVGSALGATGAAASALGSGAINFALQIAGGANPVDALKSAVISAGTGAIANQVGSMLPTEVASVGKNAITQLITTGKIDPTALATSVGTNFAADALASETGMDKATAGRIITAGMQAMQGNELAALTSLVRSGITSGQNSLTPTGGLADYGDINTQGQDIGVNGGAKDLSGSGGLGPLDYIVDTERDPNLVKTSDVSFGGYKIPGLSLGDTERVSGQAFLTDDPEGGAPYLNQSIQMLDRAGNPVLDASGQPIFYTAIYDPTDQSLRYSLNATDESGTFIGKNIISQKPQIIADDEGNQFVINPVNGRILATLSLASDQRGSDSNLQDFSGTESYLDDVTFAALNELANGVENVSGVSGVTTDSGFSGFSGELDDSDLSKFLDVSGFSGVSGDLSESGFSGFSGVSGDLGFSGFSGESGVSGFSGVSGESGASGFSGVSGESGASGFSGFSGESGTSGFSGLSGVSGTSGFSGVSGESGASGFSGVSGESGSSGFSGFSGESGVSGFSGFSGESGISGWSGVSGESGASGFSGMSGESGTSGFSGFSGESGTSGFSGYSGASGDSGFSGASGVSGISGFSGFSGDSGVSGFSGYSGASGVSGFSGASGVSGESGFSGYSGVSGVSGFSGFSGTSGLSGFSGASGVSGESGFSGFSGVSGVSGFSGYSGTSGLSGFSGTSGVSGTSGFSGFSGVSGVSGVSGFSGFSGTAGRDGKSVYAPAAVSSVAAAPAAIDWLGQRMLESKTRGGYRDPLAEFLALQQDIEKESLLKQLQPELANVLAERNAMPYYSYGQEPPIEDVLGLPGGESSSYNESDYVPMFKAGGKVSPLNIQMMYAKGGHTREDFRDGKHVAGPGDGQSDDIPAWLADGEFVFPADVVSALGNGSTKAGTEKLYDMMHKIRARARSSKEKDLPPPAHKSPLDYLKTKKGK